LTPEPREKITGTFPLDAFLGREMGGYRLVERVGEGGMGVVYRALPAGDPDAEPVAVKVIKRGMDTDNVLRRFQREQAILAALEHPHIARLIASGATADGLPYVVMEYIDGKPLLEYCDQARLSVAARLELFRKICDAVECAHAKQVVHRDIKPSNILVTAGGEPKLLDFGIAKILDRDLLRLSQEVTETHAPVMTPQYASPEQVRGEPVTPLSDVYGLGMLLYELLTGRRPYRVRGYTAHEVERAIRAQAAQRPSAAALRPATFGEAGAEAAAAARACSPRTLHDRLRGDLDAIILKALSKHPGDRYRSVADFSADVFRHMRGAGVKAPRPGLLYGARARIALVALLAAALALAGWWTWRGRVAPARRSVAVLGFENLSRQPSSQWLSTALTEMLSTELAAGGALRTVAGEQVSQVKQELALADAPTYVPATLERLRRSLNADYVVLGSYLALGEGAEMRVRLDVRLQDTRDGELAAAMTETRPSTELLGLVSLTGALLRRKLGAPDLDPRDSTSIERSLPADPEAARRYAEGLEKLRRFDLLPARELLRAAVRRAPDHALSHAALASAAGQLGYDPEARAEAKRALDLSGDLGRESQLWIRGRYFESVKQWDRAAETFQTMRQFYPDNLEYGLRLAGAQWRMGEARRALTTVAELRKQPAAAQDLRIDYAEAEAALAASDLKRAREAAARAASRALAQGLRMPAARARIVESRVLLEMGAPQESLRASGEAKKLFEAAGHRQGVSSALSEAAGVLTQLGDVAAARASFEEALAICRTTGDQACLGDNLDSIGVLLRRQGDLRGALAKHEQALEARREVGDRAGVAMALYNIGNVREVMGDLQGARAADTESLDIRRSLGLKRAGALTMSRLAVVRRKQGELPEALAMARDSVQELRSIGDRGGVAMALYNLGLILFDQGDLAGARAAYEEALGIRRSQRDKNNTAQVLAALAEVAIAEDKLHDARLYLEESNQIREALGEKLALAQNKLAMAALLMEEGNPQEAVRCARDAAPEIDRIKAAPAQAEAYLALGEALLAARQPAEARIWLQAAAARTKADGDRTLHLRALFLRARIEAAQGSKPQALRTLEEALAEAGRYGVPAMELEARLAMSALGRGAAQPIAADAAKAGFALLARKASRR
jgi:tetratricopeptide (TPR) repeat protein/predicted Ser/Thr protein kinase